MRTTTSAMVALAAALVFVDSPTPLRAQEPDSVALARAVAATPSGSMVRVSTPARLLEGALGEAGSTDLRISVQGEDLSVSYAEVFRYWERDNASKEGFITGGLLGLAIGGLFGLEMASCCGDGPGSELRYAAKGGASFGLAGALLGVIVGSEFSRWRLRWETSATTRPR